MKTIPLTCSLGWLLYLGWFCSHPCFAQSSIDSMISNTIELSWKWSEDSAIVALNAIRLSPEFEQAGCEYQADLYFEIGINYFSASEEAITIQYWQDTALVIYEECLGASSFKVAKTRFNIGLAFRYLQEYANALKAFKEGIVLFEQMPGLEKEYLASRYLEIGKYFEEIADYEQALIYLNQALKNYNTALVFSGEEIADLYNYLGICYDNLKDYGKAISYFNKSKKIYKNIGETDLSFLDQNLAFAHLYKGEFDKGILFVEQAIISNTQNRNYFELVKNLNCLGVLQKRKGQYEKALQTFQQARQAAEQAYETRFHTEIAAGYENAADVYLLQNKTDTAIQFYQNAIEALVPDFAPASAYDNPAILRQASKNKSYLQRVLDLKGQALYQRYDQNGRLEDLEGALACYLTLDTLSNLLRQQLEMGSARYRLQKYLVPIYERGIKVALKSYEQTNQQQHLEAAFQLLSKNKALILLDGLQAEDARIDANLPVAILEEERQLKRQLANLETAILNLEVLEESKELSELKDQWFETRRNYEKLIDQLEQDYPNYYNLKYAFRNTFSLADIQDWLPDDGNFIEYFVGEQQLFAFSITKQGIDYFKWEKPANFDATCLSFRESSQAATDNWRAEYVTSCYQIYQWLLEPILATAPPTNNRLFIVPDGILLQIAFDALLTAPTPTWLGKDNPYLLKQFSVAQAYANAFFIDPINRNRIKSPEIDFLGFGIEYDDYTLKQLEQLIGTPDSLIQKRAAGKLPYSDDEVLEIAKLLNGLAITNTAATKAQFLDQAAQPRILHLAMHGVLNELAPSQSGLIFNGTPDSDDFILRASEIYQMQLSAEMAVLSACNTGFGRLEQGEGVRSLARAFAYAGCPSLVASLWEAPDNSTKEILVLFYQFLKEGLPKDIALQKAKLAYMDAAPQAFSTPNFWGHLEVIGEVAPLYERSFLKRWWYLVFIPILIFGIFSFRKVE